ncbi:Baculoviral IAP repeat-containing protein 5 [Mactra antiquata]
MPRKGSQAKKSSKKNKKDSILIKSGDLADYENPKRNEYCMIFEDCRKKTFSDWPFDGDNSCNPAALAAAGFYHIPTNEEPDAARCFCCFKELDGWEPDDNPWSEHKRHSPDCAFLSLNKQVQDLTVTEFLKLECERQKNEWRKFIRAKSKEVDIQAEHTSKEMAKLVK